MALAFGKWWLVCLLVLSVGGVVPVACVEGAEQPNVLFLICDDLNCDLGCYGHRQVKSPNIDRLAKQGVRFEKAYCQYPLCGPSRASFMTGLYPDQTLIQTNEIALRERLPKAISMSQLFKENGYFSSRIGKIYHYGVPRHIGTAGHDDPYSWDYTVNPRGRDKDDEADVFTLVPGQYGGTLSWLAAEGTDEEQTDGIAALEAARQLEKFAKTGQSFYLAVGLYRPHTPYVAPKKYFDMYPRDQIVVPEIPEGYRDSLPKPARQTISKKDQMNLSDDLARQAIQAYYASITFADAQLGVILDALEKTGLDKNTIVVFTSDHGYHMGEHGHYQKTTLFENATHVPLIISVPGMKAAGQTASSPAEMIDFYPTLAELAGLTPPENLSGVSLVAALNDPAATPRTAALSQYRNGYSLRTDRYRYTAWGANGEAGEELYDHQSDREEMHNVVGEEKYQTELSELRELMKSRVAAARQRPKGLIQRLPGEVVK